MHRSTLYTTEENNRLNKLLLNQNELVTFNRFLKSFQPSQKTKNYKARQKTNQN